MGEHPSDGPAQRPRLREYRVFLAALVFYTRLPVPMRTDRFAELLARSARYLPLIGLFVGAVSAGAYIAIGFLLPHAAAIVVALAVGVLITGAFHEDGLIDSADGLGGGHTVERKLEIMKDSRVGSYGVIAAVLVLLLKFVLLSALAAPESGAVRVSTGVLDLGARAIIAMHLLGRLAPVLVMAVLRYARPGVDSRSRPAARVGVVSLMIALVTAVVAGWFLLPEARLALAAPAVVASVAALVFLRHLRGYTGDTLGAAEQLTEIAVLAVIVTGLPSLVA